MTIKDSEDIRHIIIVGGGTAGWMAACYLSRFLSRVESKITLIESPSVTTIGVGEATLPTLVRFVRNMGFDEMEFMRRCKASYKLGIKFINWVEQEHSYWHPFGVCGVIIDGMDLFHFWFNAGKHHKESYSDYSLQALIADSGKSPNSAADESKIMEAGAYAYHLDAAALADYLKEKAISFGVDYIQADVTKTALNEKGEIDSITSDDGSVLTADFYIDCTGFRAELIANALDTPFIDWSDSLLCNRAVAVSFEADSKMHANTHAIALDAGWSWQIPLNDRLGCGYVYSSAHKADTDAFDELSKLMCNQKALNQEPLFLSMPVGHRQQFWRGNCLALGLSAGFLEPLESTGIHLIQHGLEMFMDYFPDKKLLPSLINTYNEKMTTLYDDTRGFLMLHYLLSQRDDTAFWRDCRSVEIPASLESLLDLYDESGIIEGVKPGGFPASSYFHILSSGARFPRRALPMVNVSDQARVRRILDNIKEKNNSIVSLLPNHKEWLELHM